MPYYWLAAKTNKMTHLEVGDKVPDFEGKDQDGNTISSQTILGNKSIIYFYPKDSTPGCTKEACNLRDHSEMLKKEGYQIVGVSADSEKSHSKFIKKYGLTFPLIADIDYSVIKAFGVWGPKKFMGKEFDGIHRTTFITDKQGTISNIFKKVKTKAHAEQIMEKEKLIRKT